MNVEPLAAAFIVSQFCDPAELLHLSGLELPSHRPLLEHLACPRENPRGKWQSSFFHFLGEVAVLSDEEAEIKDQCCLNRAFAFPTFSSAKMRLTRSCFCV